MFSPRSRLFLSVVATAMLSAANAQAQAPPPAREPKEAVERGLAEQMRPFVFLEIRFAAAVCDLSKEERLAIAKRAKPMIDDLARDFLREEARKEAGVESNANRGIDPERRLLAALRAIIKTQVSTDRWSRYEHEVQKRAADRRQSRVDNLVAALNRELILTPAQRQALRSLLIEEWKLEWNWSHEIYMDMESEACRPPIPERRIAPILSETQRKAFDKLPVRTPQPWDPFGLEADLFELTRTAEEHEIEKAAGFETEKQ